MRRRWFGLQLTATELGGIKLALARVAMKLQILAGIIAVALFGSAARVQAQLVPFRDADRGLWGYRVAATGSVEIPAQFLGAGAFVDGRAPVEDRLGFAIIDPTGRVTERVRTDSVATRGVSIPPPSDECAWPRLSEFPSGGLECYARELRADSPTIGGEITRRIGGEGASSATFHRLASGVVVIVQRGYEGVRMRVFLPGVTADEAANRRSKLFTDRPPKPGCGEYWSSGAIPGGAYIEQHAGC